MFFLHKYVGRPLQAKAFGEDLTHNTQIVEFSVSLINVSLCNMLSFYLFVVFACSSFMSFVLCESPQSSFKTVFQLCPLSLL